MSAKPMIKVEFTPGDTIDEAFAGAIELANRTNAVIQFNFNGVTCMAMAGCKVARGVDAYHQSIKREKILIAWA